MINPLINVFEAFLAIYNNLPFALIAFIDISLVLLIVVIIVSVIRGR